tara:strand:+ start:41722 stop:42153 length:432 start_codon:yes stop_codon:yes gene_type:complete
MSTTTSIAKQPQSKSALFSLCAYFGTLLALFFISDMSLAADAADGSLGDIAGTVTDSMTNVSKLITATSYVAGVGFAMMGMLKFKAHKDNPTQVPLSQPIVLLVIAAGLVFLPNLISTGGSTIWGDGEKGRADATGGGLDAAP